MKAGKPRRRGRGAPLWAAVAAALLAALWGCASVAGRVEIPPEPVAAPAAPALPPPVADNGTAPGTGGPRQEETAPPPAGEREEALPPAPEGAEEGAAEEPSRPQGPAEGAPAELPEGAPGAAEEGAAGKDAAAERARPTPPAPEGRHKPRGPQAPLHEEAGLPEPAWAKAGDDLVFRISYLGVTAGYARFTYVGKAVVEGRETYHIHVRAWTSSLLAVVYPLNDVLDYFLDVRTLAPVRQDFTQRERNKSSDTISIYDQEKGSITTRDRSTGRFLKRVSVVPNVHDPVTAVYNFRARGQWGDGYVSRIYAGRKLWEIQANKAGAERIRMEDGRELDTVLVRPVIRRDGKIENKGDLRLWLSNDPRYLPLRVYAKIKLGTLVGELVPKEGGGGYAAR